MITLDNTYRTIKNEDYEKLVNLANLNKRAVDEIVNETLGEFKGEVKQLKDSLIKCEEINGDFRRLNNSILHILSVIIIQFVPKEDFSIYWKEYNKLAVKNTRMPRKE